MATSRKKKSGVVVTNPAASRNKIPSGYPAGLHARSRVVIGQAVPPPPVTAVPREKPSEIITPARNVRVTGDPERTQRLKGGQHR